MQSAPIEVPADAPNEARSPSPADSEEVVEPAPGGRSQLDPGRAAPDPAGSDGESGKRREEDDDEPEQVSDPRLNPKHAVA